MNASKILVWRKRHRSWKKDALLTAGMAGAGIAIGALTKGRKGAAIGAISGGVARLIWRIAAA